MNNKKIPNPTTGDQEAVTSFVLENIKYYTTIECCVRVMLIDTKYALEYTYHYVNVC